jgi:hypothetical protein
MPDNAVFSGKPFFRNYWRVRAGFSSSIRSDWSEVWSFTAGGIEIGIPIPWGLWISYDTLKQIATLRWFKEDTNIVKSYNIYERDVDSNTVLTRINASPVIDTIYYDSTGISGITYEYRVAAVDSSGHEGVKSAGASVKW